MSARRPAFRLSPATSTIHLDFNAYEDVDIELTVEDDNGVPLPLESAVAQIRVPGGPLLHEWSEAAGNITVGPEHGVVVLRCSSADTGRWWVEFAESEWDLNTVDVFGRRKRPCEGQVQVRDPRTVPHA